MRKGDLVISSDTNETETGVVIKIRYDVEIPPLIDVMWSDGRISSSYQDDLEVVNENRR